MSVSLAFNLQESVDPFTGKIVCLPPKENQPPKKKKKHDHKHDHKGKSPKKTKHKHKDKDKDDKDDKDTEQVCDMVTFSFPYGIKMLW